MNNLSGKKNHMRTPKQKEKIVLKYLTGQAGFRETARHYSLSLKTLREWVLKYNEDGINGLISQTGKKRGGTKGQGRRLKKLKELQMQG